MPLFLLVADSKRIGGSPASGFDQAN